jgi:transposase-like protein
MVRSGRSVPAVAEALDVSQQSLRNWVKQGQVDARERDDGLASADWEELRRLRRENARLRQGVICSNEPRPSSQRRPRPGDGLPDDLG